MDNGEEGSLPKVLPYHDRDIIVISKEKNEFNDNYGEQEISDENLHQIFVEHMLEPGLDELYQMSMEQEAEQMIYGWRPCGMDEVERL